MVEKEEMAAKVERIKLGSQGLEVSAQGLGLILVLGLLLLEAIACLHNRIKFTYNSI